MSLLLILLTKDQDLDAVLSNVYFGCFLSISNEIWLKKVKAMLPHWNQIVLAPPKYGSLINSLRQGGSGASGNSGPRPFPHWNQVDSEGQSGLKNPSAAPKFCMCMCLHMCVCVHICWAGDCGKCCFIKTPKPSE